MGLRDELVTSWRVAKAWLRDGRPLWLWLAVAVVLLAVPHFFPVAAGLSDRVRWSGMLFQFAGLTPAILGLNKARRHFGKSSIWTAAGQWLGQLRYIFWRPKSVSASVATSTGAAVASGFTDARATRSGGTLEDRVNRLEADMERIEEKLPGIEQDVRKLRDDTNKLIERERTQRQENVLVLRKILESVTVDDIHLLLGGVVYLFVGIALATIPDEIASVLQ